jgi:hypothetical protein
VDDARHALVADRADGEVHVLQAEPVGRDPFERKALGGDLDLYNAPLAWLVNAHKALDAAVAQAYGWPDGLSDEEILSRLLAFLLARSNFAEGRLWNSMKFRLAKYVSSYSRQP